VVKGMVLRRDTEGTAKLVKDAKVAVFAQVRLARQWTRKVQEGQGAHLVTSVGATSSVSAAWYAMLVLPLPSLSCPAGRGHLGNER
jgi:hypothetical protein